MAVPFSNTKLRVPRGFQNLIEGFAREVLRSQPENIYDFGAKYFEAALKRREDTGQDPAEHEAAVEDRFYNNKAFTTKTVDINNVEQQGAATKIQTKYRQYAAKQEVDDRRQDLAAAKIQAGFRGYKDRIRINDMKNEQIGMVQSLGDDTIDAGEILKRRIEEDEQPNTAPLESGAQTQLSALPDDEGGQDNEDQSDESEKQTHQAASIIQAGFRGMQTRRKIKDIKNPTGQGDEVADERIEGEGGDGDADNGGEEGEADAEAEIAGEAAPEGEADATAQPEATEEGGEVVLDDQLGTEAVEGAENTDLTGDDEAQDPELPAEDTEVADDQPTE